MFIQNITKLGRLPLNQANQGSKRVIALLGLASLLMTSGCGHHEIPSSIHDRSGLTDPSPALEYDHIQYENTSAYDIPSNNLYARLPSVQAYLSESGGSNYVGGKSAYHADFPAYILIESADIDKWRYAQVDSPKANRSYYAPPMRLPVNKTLPTGQYITVRPVTKLWPPAALRDPKNPTPDAYLFQVLARADAKEKSGNLLTLVSAVTSTNHGDWVVPISYLDLPQQAVSSVMEDTPPTVIAFAPGNLTGASGHLAVVRGGLNQGLSYGDNVIVLPGRLKGLHGRALRDGRDLRPEGIARGRVVQATSDYALIDIIDSAQQITEGDILWIRDLGKSK